MKPSEFLKAYHKATTPTEESNKMIVQIFATHDSKAKAYNQPFFMHNKDMAQRSFSEAVNNPESHFYKHPLDYTLFHLGSYDDELGLLTPLAPPEMIITATQIKDNN